MARQKRIGKPLDKAGKKKIHDAAQVIMENLEAHKLGRPPHYHVGFCHIAEQAELIGCTNIDLGEILGASTYAIDDWIRRYPDFASAVMRGRANTDLKVERSLVAAIGGYTHPEEVFMTEGVGQGESRIRRIKTTKHYAPDTRAAAFWLKNRQPNHWKPDTKLLVTADVKDAASMVRDALRDMQKATVPEEKK